MKTFTKLLYTIILLLFFSYTSVEVLAQNNNLPDQDCFYESPDGCITIGYQSVTPHINQPGESQNPKLDVEIVFQACSDVTEILITPTQGQIIRLTGSQITGGIQTFAFTVNANSFKDGKLKIALEFVTGQKTTVSIVYREELDCGALIPLGVELTSFTGIATQSGVNLNWTTASEENNSHFEVQRSSDGQVYDQIATVQGRGNSSVTQKYTFVDVSPKQGVNYYRLKQIDFDGQSAYSKIIAVQSKLSKEMRVTVAPNPCRNGDCEVVLQGLKGARKTLLELKDMSGKVVLSKTVEDGTTRLSPDEISGYKGLFILSATSGNEVVHQRIILE